MIERNRVTVVVESGVVTKVLSSHPIILDIVDLDKLGEELEFEQINLEALEQLLPYQIDIN